MYRRGRFRQGGAGAELRVAVSAAQTVPIAPLSPPDPKNIMRAMPTFVLHPPARSLGLFATLPTILGSLVHLCIGFLALPLTTLVTRGGHLHSAVVPWPLLPAPVTLWALGGTWIVSALGAFLRDLNHVTVALTQVLLYSSAVFYPLSRVATPFRNVLRFNPLVYLCEQSRNLFAWGEGRDRTGYTTLTLSDLAVAFVGYQLLVNVKPAFADVV